MAPSRAVNGSTPTRAGALNRGKLVTLVAGKAASFVVYGRRRRTVYDKKPQRNAEDNRTAFNCIHSGKPETEVSNNKRRANYRRIQSIARPLCDSKAPCVYQTPRCSLNWFPTFWLVHVELQYARRAQTSAIWRLTSAEIILDSNPAGLIRIRIRISPGSLPKCCGFIILLASVTSSSVVKIGQCSTCTCI